MMLRTPGTGLTAPAVAGRGLSEGLGIAAERKVPALPCVVLTELLSQVLEQQLPLLGERLSQPLKCFPG